jgi:hypothetical protein
MLSGSRSSVSAGTALADRDLIGVDRLQTDVDGSLRVM